MGYRLQIRRSGGCETTGPQPVWNGLLRQSRLAEMMGDELWLQFDKLWEPSFDRCGNPLMQLLAAPLEQAFIGGITHQGVLEHVSGGGREASPENELRGNQAIERRGEFRLGHRHHGRKQLVVEFAADTGADLGHLLQTLFRNGTKKSERSNSTPGTKVLITFRTEGKEKIAERVTIQR